MLAHRLAHRGKGGNPGDDNEADGTGDGVGDRKKTKSAAGTPPNVGTPALPFFWSSALQNSDFSELIDPKTDFEILSYLTDITSESNDDEIVTRFHFDPRNNPFFTNEVLEKKVMITPSSPYLDDVDVHGTTATKIKWTGEALRDRKMKMRRGRGRGRKGKDKRNDKKDDDHESDDADDDLLPISGFFDSFFRNLGTGSSDEVMRGIRKEEVEDDENDDGVAELLSEILTEHFQMAQVMHDSIIPHAIRYYNDEVQSDEDDSDETDEDDDEDDEDDDTDGEER